MLIVVTYEISLSNLTEIDQKRSIVQV